MFFAHSKVARLWFIYEINISYPSLFVFIVYKSPAVILTLLTMYIQYKGIVLKSVAEQDNNRR